MALFRDIIEGKKKDKGQTMRIEESAIPSELIDETKFEAQSIDEYLIVFVDIVNSTQKFEAMGKDMKKITSFFSDFHKHTISAFRDNISEDFKFKMLGDGLLFFVGIESKQGLLLPIVYKNKCHKLYNELKQILDIRIIAGLGKLIEFDVGLANGWTDYYGVAINNIVHASDNMEGEFKWIKK